MLFDPFADRWRGAGGAERANYGLFLQDLCDLIGVDRPEPTSHDPARDVYVLERAVTFNDGAGKQSTGRIDLYKRGCFVLETKQGSEAPDQQEAGDRAALGLEAIKRRRGHAQRGTAKWEQIMQAARQQALGYVRALPADEPKPPFVVVADVGYCLDVYANFSGVGEAYVPFPDQNTYRIFLDGLSDPAIQERLRAIWTDPQSLDPARRAARVTRALAGHLAELSKQLEGKHPSEEVAQFLMRCLFTMFAEDVELIPGGSFTGMLREYRGDRLKHLPLVLQNLWERMDRGGFSSELGDVVPQFNGKLFHSAKALPLNPGQMELLLKASEADWREVEPAIFGTLLERALDPRERHSLGAHYTPRRYVERLVLPTVMEPLREEWTAAQAAASQLLEQKDEKGARQQLLNFLQRLTSIRILDPACGSGNFLYVTLEHLKRLEGEVLSAINSYGKAGLLNLGGGTTVSPRQLLGLELNPRAAAIADVVLRIGYLQWHLRTHGRTELPQPLLDEYQNIENRDAALAHDAPVPRLDKDGQPVTRWDGVTFKTHPATGRQIPDETALVVVSDYPNPRPAQWPEADFIVGNPPFIGKLRMREALGDGYVEALREAYSGSVPDAADFVMYWWHNAGNLLASGVVERIGFITTNSITQIYNRRVIESLLVNDKSPISLRFAIPNHPWVDNSDGAAVRIAMTVASKEVGMGKLVSVIKEWSINEEGIEVELVEEDGIINSDLTIGANVAGSKELSSNSDLALLGVKFYGKGFILNTSEASTLQATSSSRLVKPFISGQDLTQTHRGLFVIDAFGFSVEDLIKEFPDAYQHLWLHVKPERDHNPRETRRLRWWIFGENQPSMRNAIKGLKRYIVTGETAKHRLFQFIPGDWVAEGKAIVIATDDAYILGILSTRIHAYWSLAAGGRLGVGDTPVYNKSRCFDPFPFPAATEAQKARIRELAETLDAHRKRQQAQHPTLTLTDLYNVVEKLRAGQALSTKDKAVNEQGLASVALSLHQQIDAAVAEAYGWPANLPEAEILQRLVALNHARTAEEAAGTVRYLRPEYQAPQIQQASLALETQAKAAAPTTEAAAQPWPKELAKQMQAVRSLVLQSSTPLTAAQVAKRFDGAKPRHITPLLETLAEMALLRPVDEAGAYAA